MADEVLTHIAANVKLSHYIGIQADEIADNSKATWSVHLLHHGKAVNILLFCNSWQRQAICSQIIKELKGQHVDVKNCRAQACNGAGAMSGHLDG